MRTRRASGDTARRPTLVPTLLAIGLSLGGLVVGGLALGAVWKDYSPAFPGLPCTDGWAGCLVGDKAVSPGMVLDAGARPTPGDMRIGFFDLDPLPSLSPFGGLSQYSGTLQAAKPAGPPSTPPTSVSSNPSGEGEGEVAQVRSGSSGSRGVNPDEDAAATDALNRQAAESFASRQGQTGTSGDASAGRTIENPTSSGRSGADANPPSTARTTAPPSTAPPGSTPTSGSGFSGGNVASNTPPPVTTPPVSTPPVTTPPVTTPPVTTPPVTTPPVTDIVQPQDNSCDDLVALEAPAMMGQLGMPRRKCLEARMSSEPAQTTKGKISRVLMADAEARRDQADWERLIKNHLENIDRSDPALCFKYAIFLSRGGASKASQVIRWSDYALENKQQWSGPTYTKNVYALMKLKTQAANALWQAAEQEFVDSRNDEAEDRANKWRGTTKNYALEWLDYAKASSQDTKAPLAICVSAAGNKEFCEG